MNFYREKLEKRIRESLSKILLYEVEDPRIHFCLINRVVCSRDLRYAKIYVSFFGGKEKEKVGMTGLSNASKFIQSLLAKELQVRFVPLLSFHLEENPEGNLQTIKRINEVLSEEVKPLSEESEQANLEDDSPVPSLSSK